MSRLVGGALVSAALLTAAPGLGQTDAAGSYYPLGPGTVWVYEARYEVSGPPELPVRTGSRTERIDGTVEHDGETLYRFRSTLEGLGAPPVTGESLLRAAPDGIHARTEPTARETLLLPLPPTAGRTWTWSDEWGRWEAHVSRAAAAETPAGRFDDCVDVTLEVATAPGQAHRGLRRVSTYCRGVGLVRQLSTTQSPGPTGPLVSTTDEHLTRYEPGDGAR